MWILHVNNGPAEAVALKARALGTNLSHGSAVVRHLLRTDCIYKRSKCRSYILKAKKSRYASRMRNYEIHSDMHYSKGISDPKPDFSDIPSLSDHSYV
jgi:hypothetical protein